MKSKFYAVWNWTLMLLESLVIGLFRGFAIIIPVSMWLGFIIYFCSYLEMFVGEERAADFATKHPILTLLLAAAFMVLTCGGAWWAYTRSLSDVSAKFERRKARYSRLFKVAA